MAQGEILKFQDRRATESTPRTEKTERTSLSMPATLQAPMPRPQTFRSLRSFQQAHPAAPLKRETTLA